MRLLIVAPNWLGDAVMALPAVADVRRALPDASISVAGRSSVAPLFALVPGIEVSVGRIGGRHDAALLMPNSFHAALETWRARIPERWGYRTDCRGLLLTRGVDRAPRGLHQIDYYRHLVAALGFSNGAGEPRLDTPPEAREEGKTILIRAGWDETSPIVALAPGAAYGGAKRWPPEHFAELANALAADGIVTALVGSAADRSTGAEVEPSLRQPRRTLNLIGATTLPALAGVFSHCRALVTNDSGAMHLAAAVGIPVTAVFGPTNEQATAPRGFGHAIVTNPVSCRPCMLRECPIDHRCMRGIPVGAVLEYARRAL